MPFVELTCGHCESHMQIDSDWDESVWLMTHRFADAHIVCGLFTDRQDLPMRVADTDDGSSSGD